jgi:hypothetical protein
VEIKTFPLDNHSPMIARLASGGPGAKAGMMPGDLLSVIDNASVNTPESAGSSLRVENAGKAVKIIVTRGGRPLSFCVTLEEMPKESAFETVAEKPSFDCAKAYSIQDLLTCSTPKLADADRKMAERLSALAATKDRFDRSLDNSQFVWKNTARGKCLDVECLMSAYEERIDLLSHPIQPKVLHY